MQEYHAHAPLNAGRDFFDRFVGNGAVIPMSPPEQDVRLFQDLVGKAVHPLLVRAHEGYRMPRLFRDGSDAAPQSLGVCPFALFRIH